MVGEEQPPLSTDNFEAAYKYLKSKKSIRDVLISGGDPLIMKTEVLEGYIAKLRSIPHIEVIRIGTRVPVTLPMRVDEELTAMLRKYHPIMMSIHFSHPKEITPEVSKACGMLADAGIPLGSQTVLLKGVNDRPAVMKKLVHELETTTVYVTHDQVEAMTMSDRIMVMHQGRVQQLDTPHQIYHYPANTFVAELIGSPPMNLFPAELERQNGTLCVRVGSAVVRLPADTPAPNTAERRVIAGVRPEWFRRVPVETPGAFVADVEVVEPQGVDTILDLRAGETKLVARVDGETLVRAGETVAFEPLPHKVRLFDPTSGQRIA